MTRLKERNGFAQPRTAAMSSDYALRAAMAIDRLVPGPHRDKNVARLFGCSVRLAQYLRRGQHWTAERLSQASRALGVEFDRLIAAPSTNDLHARLDRLMDEIDALRRDLGRGDNGR